jgi:hypothetical protein
VRSLRFSADFYLVSFADRQTESLYSIHLFALVRTATACAEINAFAAKTDRFSLMSKNNRSQDTRFRAFG